ALLALKRDLAANRILRDDGDFVASALEEIIDELPVDGTDEDGDAGEAGEVPAQCPRGIGMPVRDTLDELSPQPLAVLLRTARGDFEILPSEALLGEKIAEVEAKRPAAVCVLSLPPGDLTATRHAAKRLHARVPSVAVIVGRLGAGAAPERSRRLLRTAGIRDVGFSLQKLEELLGPIVRGAARAANGVPADTEPELSAAR